MAQIRCCLALFAVIAFFCCTLARRPGEEENDKDQAYYNSRHRWEEVQMGDRCGESNSANKPRYYKWCFYPYEDNVPHGCHHYVFFGNKIDGDKKIFKKDYKKTESKQAPVITKLQYPSNGSTNNTPVNMISVENFNGSVRAHEDKICIREGGINGTFFEIIVTSNYTYGTRGYTATVWGLTNENH